MIRQASGWSGSVENESPTFRSDARAPRRRRSRTPWRAAIPGAASRSTGRPSRCEHPEPGRQAWRCGSVAPSRTSGPDLATGDPPVRPSDRPAARRRTRSVAAERVRHRQMTHPLFCTFRSTPSGCPPRFVSLNGAPLSWACLEIPHDPIGHRSESVSGEEPVAVMSCHRTRSPPPAALGENGGRRSNCSERLSVHPVEVQPVNVSDPPVGAERLEPGRVHPGTGRTSELADRVHVHVAKKRPPLSVWRGSLPGRTRNPRDSAEAADATTVRSSTANVLALGIGGEARPNPLFLMDHLVAEPSSDSNPARCRATVFR